MILLWGVGVGVKILIYMLQWGMWERLGRIWENVGEVRQNMGKDLRGRRAPRIAQDIFIFFFSLLSCIQAFGADSRLEFSLLLVIYRCFLPILMLRNQVSINWYQSLPPCLSAAIERHGW